MRTNDRELTFHVFCKEAQECGSRIFDRLCLFFSSFPCLHELEKVRLTISMFVGASRAKLKLCSYRITGARCTMQWHVSRTSTRRQLVHVDDLHKHWECMGSSTKGGKAKGIVTSFHYTFGWWRKTLTENYLLGSSVWGFLALVDLLHACVDNLIDMYPPPPPPRQ